jgi:AbrB family looped-hinge helix DNA binding protein
MHTTIDKAGRLIVPAAIRAQIGLVPGPVDISVDGNGIRIEIVASDDLVERDGRLLLAADGPELTADDIRELRLADQK